MDKKLVLFMGLPMAVQNRVGKKAVIELSKGEFVVCRYYPDNSCYLNDAALTGWYPTNIFKRLFYRGIITFHRIVKASIYFWFGRKWVPGYWITAAFSKVVTNKK